MTTELPLDLLERAQAAFISGFNAAAVVSAIGIAILAILAAIALKHVSPLAVAD
jgi:DHA2 family multidrug resistance protein-like MFS transporter